MLYVRVHQRAYQNSSILAQLYYFDLCVWMYNICALQRLPCSMKCARRKNIFYFFVVFIIICIFLYSETFRRRVLFDALAGNSNLAKNLLVHS